MSRHPEVKWAQREDKVFLTVLLPDAKNAKINLEPEGVFTFTATAGADNHQYDLKLELFDKVNVEESKINTGLRSIFCILEKEEKQWWKKLLRDAKTPHYVKVDWDKWQDEDDEPSKPDNDMEGMDFSNFGGMGGMGIPGMEGLGGMGGMPGMGGMGGMPDMGDFSMGDDLDSDGEDQEAAKPEGETKAGEAADAKAAAATPST